MGERKKILWLASWYPNRNDGFDGDFIQRHARAAAIYHDVHVLFVTDAEIETAVEEEWNYATGLTEQIIYFKKINGLLRTIRKPLTWKNLFQMATKKYIEKHGKPDYVHVHVPWKAGLIALWVKKKYGIDFIVTEHWGIYNHIVEDNFYTKPALTQKLLKKVFTKARHFLSVSEYLADGVCKISGIKADAIIPNVVDITLFTYKEAKHSKFTFIHVSNMVPLKNVKGILDAFKQLTWTTTRDVQLIMVGNRNDEYINYASSLGLLNNFVFFRGEMAYREVAEEMQRSHCFVLNSVMENSPCVIGEALCCGLPVIATDVGGISELVDVTNSILIPSQDTIALSTAMENVIEAYDSFNQKQIAEKASIKFGHSAVAAAFNNLYTRTY